MDVVEVIDQRVPLQQRGRDYWACCPFHEEKTPSFSVSRDKQFYHCFGCGASGSAIGFLMQYANMGFQDAVHELADGKGLTVPTEGRQTPDQTPLLKLLEQVAAWYREQLQSPAGAPARAYLDQRGVDAESRSGFALGFAPPGASNILKRFGGNAESRAGLERAGLIKRNERGAYDTFRQRLIFPIHDGRGRVIGFGGRALGDAEPKYLNSPETPLFHKRNELYGLHRARRETGKAGYSVVVEGYMDVISMAQAGFGQTVATLGTAASETHIRRLFQLADEIKFCFDGDRAGHDAARKALKVALPELQAGRQVSFVFLPEGEDPDSLLKRDGAEGMSRALKESRPLSEWLFEDLQAGIDLAGMEGRMQLVERARPLLAQLPAGALARAMWQRLSDLSGVQCGPDTAPAPKPEAQPGAESAPSPMARAIGLLLQYPELAQTVEPSSLTDLKIPGAEPLRMLVERCRRDPLPTTAQLIEFVRDSEQGAYLTRLAGLETGIAPDLVADYFNDTLHRLLAGQAARRRGELTRKGTLSAEEQQELRRLLAEKRA